jgi:DNA invertase Pin-like site-specific DNA recombinase
MRIFYGRASTNHQEMSCDIQLNEVESAFGPVDKKYFDLGVSGAAPIEKREAFLEMLENLKRGDEVFIYSLSRIARDTLTNLYLEKEIVKAGATIHSVKEDFADTPEAVMMRTILSAFATYEREMIKARTKAAKKTMRDKGLYNGGSVEYGYRVSNGSLIGDEEQQSVIDLIKDWKSSGDKIKTIQRKLNEAGIESATGGVWHYTQVYRLVKRVA